MVSIEQNQTGSNKKKTYIQKLNIQKIDWAKSSPIRKVNGNPYAFYCMTCKKSVSCFHMGISEVKEHCNGTVH